MTLSSIGKSSKDINRTVKSVWPAKPTTPISPQTKPVPAGTTKSDLSMPVLAAKAKPKDLSMPVNPHVKPVPSWGKTEDLARANASRSALDIPPMPTLEIPEFKLPEEANVQNQLDKILGKDSLLMQRAKTIGNSYSQATGKGRGSLAAGNATNAMIDKATPVAIEDAKTAEQGALTDWKGQVDQNTLTFSKRYEERLNALGYDQERIALMVQANNSLINSFTGLYGGVMNNTDLKNSEEIINWWMTHVLHPAQGSNNAFVGDIYNYGF